MRQFALLLLFGVAACATRPPATPEAVFFARLKALCRQSFEGKVVTSDAADAEMRSQLLTMRVRNCTRNAVRIPLRSARTDRAPGWSPAPPGACG